MIPIQNESNMVYGWKSTSWICPYFGIVVLLLTYSPFTSYHFFHHSFFLFLSCIPYHAILYCYSTFSTLVLSLQVPPFVPFLSKFPSAVPCCTVSRGCSSSVQVPSLVGFFFKVSFYRTLLHDGAPLTHPPFFVLF